MEITEVRIKLMEESEDRLRAFCSITFDHCFVVRDLKIIDGVNGPFVAMPSRKLTGHCGKCGHKNHLRAQFCNQCGNKVKLTSEGNNDSPQKLYADVAHPINSVCRELIQAAVIQELQGELARAGEPGYRSRYDDEFDANDAGPETDDSEAYQQPVPKPHFNLSPNQPANQSSKQGQTNSTRNQARSDDDDGFGAGVF